ncbi:MAG: MBL fold metallo-hydrolase [Marinifilaceae bacterium]|jgi:glyoxylase-like metal-dependent hydrolase (beta-lactamase superfamily II)|nr:MBL fold metallo-hydrolase [Marinifilaceae bacterium]
MKIYNIETGNFKCDGGAMFGVVPKFMWSNKYEADDENLCKCSLRSLLIEKDNRLILIDTGTGDKQSDKFFKSQHLFGDDNLIKSLKNIGYKPQQITDVIFTHLHFDHCGGAVKYDDNNELIPVFENANHWLSKSQWENYIKPNNREADSYFKENIMPLYERGMLKFVEEDIEIIEGIRLNHFYGHSSGLLASYIDYNGKTIVFTSDFIPTAANMNPKWISAYDTQPIVSLKEKEDFLQEAFENDYIIVFQHDYYNQCGKVKKTDRGIKFDKGFNLSEVL